MFGNNLVCLVGNVGSDPEVRYFETGKIKAKFSLAVSAGKDRAPHWINCESWNRTAERVQERVYKGCRVSITGSLKQERWTDSATGKQRSAIIVNAENVEVIAKAPSAQPAYQRTQPVPQPMSQPVAPNENSDDIHF